MKASLLAELISDSGVEMPLLLLLLGSLGLVFLGKSLSVFYNGVSFLSFPLSACDLFQALKGE